ncbi:MAG: hypothetical protein II751_04300, partial [Bacteroidales bacterium]|nr:hypothetical protein [Bacteroidales bacterium]
KSIRKRMNGSFVYPSSDGYVKYDHFFSSDLQRIILQNVDAKSNVVRYVDTVDGKPYYCLEVEAWMANDVFKNYYNISHPRGGISQDRLEYTNFVSDNENAYGILASRNHCRILLKYDNTTGHNEDTLVNGKRKYIFNGDTVCLDDLNFDYYRNSPEFFEVTE